VACKGRCWYYLAIWAFLTANWYIFGHLVYLTANWYILGPFNTFFGYLVHFPQFGMLYQEQSGNPGPRKRTKCVK
jgi:hypothetical protein